VLTLNAPQSDRQMYSEGYMYTTLGTPHLDHRVEDFHFSNHSSSLLSLHYLQHSAACGWMDAFDSLNKRLFRIGHWCGDRFRMGIATECPSFANTCWSTKHCKCFATIWSEKIFILSTWKFSLKSKFQGLANG